MSNHDMTAKLGWGKKFTKIMDTMIPQSQITNTVSGMRQSAVQGTAQVCGLLGGVDCRNVCQCLLSLAVELQPRRQFKYPSQSTSV